MFGRIRSAAALMLVLAGLTFAPLVQPRTALADDAIVSSPCDDDAFDAALAAALTNGGGTITFDCGGPTTIDVDNTKTITAGNEVIIDGAGLITFDGGEDVQLFVVEAGATLALLNLTLTNGSAGEGGAIYNEGTLTVTASAFNDNHASGAGGAISNDGTLTVTTSTFSENSAGSGGAIRNANTMTVIASTFSDNSASNGGAIRNSGDSDSTHTVTSSTFSGNSANHGGAIYNFAPLEVTTSTFSANSANFEGGALYHAFRTLTVTASTFSGNNASGGGGVIFNFFPTAITIQSSILAAGSSGDNCGGKIASGGSNISNDSSCNFGSGEVGAITLGPLQDNGGPTFTMLPVDSTTIIDTANCALSTLLDQRGAPRPAEGTQCDKGAVEVAGSVPAVQLFAVSGSDGVEGSPVRVHAAGYSETDASLTFDCQGDGSFETQGSSAGSSASAACLFLDEGLYTVGARICDNGIPANCADDEVGLTVLNVAPVIESTTTSLAGASVTVTVNATDAGVNDELSYSFDCDGDEVYEGLPQAESSAVCSLDPGQADTTINVLVEDGDGGEAADSVTISQTATVCGNPYTGQLSAPATGGGCPSGTVQLTLPLATPMTVCISPYTGAMHWNPSGSCARGWLTHLVPDSGPLAYCQSLYTGSLRYAPTGQCQAHETPGVIPGDEGSTGTRTR